MSNPNHRRGPWSQNEDNYLMQLVQAQGPLNWVRIAALLGSRTAKQCRERYHQNLKPSLNHEPITAEEGIEIERLVDRHGKRWAEIARQLHGRSDNSVKNWWNGSQNRRKRSDKRKYGDRSPESFDSEPPRKVPRTMSIPQLPLPQGPINHSISRPHLPAPLQPSAMHDSSRYGIETPLSSPIYSPAASAATPSLMSDNGSPRYSTTPRTYRLSAELQLPPLQLPSMSYGFPSPRMSASPTDVKLPPMKDLISPINQARSSELPHIDRIDNVSQHYQQHSHTRDYFSSRSHLPTAPNSPVGPHLIQGLRISSGSNDSSNRMTVDRLLD